MFSQKKKTFLILIQKLIKTNQKKKIGFSRKHISCLKHKQRYILSKELISLSKTYLVFLNFLINLLFKKYFYLTHVEAHGKRMHAERTNSRQTRSERFWIWRERVPNVWRSSRPARVRLPFASIWEAKQMKFNIIVPNLYFSSNKYIKKND